MAHFAFVNGRGIVEQVIVAEQEVIDSGLFGRASSWIQTSYNTQGGVHTLGGTPLRKNFAGVGFRYDPIRDAFIPPQPYASWTLNEDTCLWTSPTPYPTDGKLYSWDEATLTWIEIPIPQTGTSESTVTIGTAADSITFGTASETITLG